jgi:homoserine kinase
LGHSLEGWRDHATVRRIDAPEVRIEGIEGVVTALPARAEDNTAGAALIAMRSALALPFGFAVQLRKGIPLGSGLGGSAASAVAAVVAANALLDAPLPAEALYAWPAPPWPSRTRSRTSSSRRTISLRCCWA